MNEGQSTVKSQLKSLLLASALVCGTAGFAVHAHAGFQLNGVDIPPSGSVATKTPAANTAADAPTVNLPAVSAETLPANEMSAPAASPVVAPVASPVPTAAPAPAPAETAVVADMPVETIAPVLTPEPVAKSAEPIIPAPSAAARQSSPTYATAGTPTESGTWANPYAKASAIKAPEAAASVEGDARVMAFAAPASGDPILLVEPSDMDKTTQPTTWRARKGEPFKDVASRWSDRAGISIYSNIPSDLRLKKDISAVGSFETAIQTALQEGTDASPDAPWFKPYQEAMLSGAHMPQNTMNDASPVKPVAFSYRPPSNAPYASSSSSSMDWSTPTPSYAPTGSANIPPVDYGSAYETAPDYTQTVLPTNEERWEVSGNASLRQTLEAWSSRAGIQMIWDAPSDYNFSQPFFVKGVYTEAVEKALDQFAEQRNSPRGTIYNDPNTGSPVLVVSQ
ncbi:MAG: TcpQ domain-containing protein [Pseudobdellovibrionaceae bacterium]